MSNWAISTSTDESITPFGGMTKAAQAKRIAQRKLETAITSFMERKAPYPQVGEGGAFFLEAIVAVAAVKRIIATTARG